ncbi:hypothetical protein SDC9_212428 [bioreactor metagenome]|uniref:Uncharacterized protein n=1 Tax=bioreactor metagenome TaxID=1076179 RepID=A0A645JMY1_9ZZZZ
MIFLKGTPIGKEIRFFPELSPRRPLVITEHLGPDGKAVFEAQLHDLAKSLGMLKIVSGHRAQIISRIKLLQQKGGFRINLRHAVKVNRARKHGILPVKSYLPGHPARIGLEEHHPSCDHMVFVDQGDVAVDGRIKEGGAGQKNHAQ